MKGFEKLSSTLLSNRTFGLFAHISPDGDTLGSCQALGLALAALGKRVSIFCDGSIPLYLRFLGVQLEDDAELIKTIDVCILVDCCEFKRVGKFGEVLKANARKLMAIDHHANVTPDIKDTYMDGKKASCAEIIYDLLKDIGMSMNKEIAQSIYTGVSTDTGSFIHASTNANSLAVACDCVNCGFDLAKTNFNLYKLKPGKQFDFYRALFKHIKSYGDEKLIIIKIDNRLYNKFAYNCEATELFGLFTGIAGNEVVAKLTENPIGNWRIGLRSSRGMDVSRIGRQFGGGGHLMAAGGAMNGTFGAVRRKLLSVFKDEEKRREMEKSRVSGAGDFDWNY